MAKRARLNPDLLIINPGPRDKAAVWRKLRRRYPIEKAAEAYGEIYPESRKSVKRNKGGAKINKSDPHYKQALKLFREFHGRDPEPDEIFEIDLPQLGEIDEDLYLVALGEAPAESYDANQAVPGSTKSGSVYVHPYEAPDGKRPLKAVTGDGRLIMTLPIRADGKPSKHKVTSKGRGEAWIHH